MEEAVEQPSVPGAGEGFEVGSTGDGSDASEDEHGYDSYFFDGTGKGNGDSGGASSSAGLRLSGKYKGWPTLEAWADRSITRWKDVGVVPDEEQVPEQAKDEVRL